MKKRDISREVYKRIYARCRWRGIHRLNLREDDLKKFVSECVDEEISKGRTGKLEKEAKVEKMIKMLKEPEKRERKIVYVNVTPKLPNENDVLQDFFVEPRPSKKEKLRRFMKGRKVPYKELMKKISEIEKDE